MATIERATLQVERACLYCGAWLQIKARAGPVTETRDYACPECGKDDEIDCADSPKVRVLNRRTDGKDDKYQETMF